MQGAYDVYSMIGTRIYSAHVYCVEVVRDPSQMSVKVRLEHHSPTLMWLAPPASPSDQICQHVAEEVGIKFWDATHTRCLGLAKIRSIPSSTDGHYTTQKQEALPLAINHSNNNQEASEQPTKYAMSSEPKENNNNIRPLQDAADSSSKRPKRSDDRSPAVVMTFSAAQ